MIDWRAEWKVFSQYRNAYLVAFSAAMGSIFYGWDIGLIGGILDMDSFREYFEIDKKSESAQSDLEGNIVSVLQAGCFFGALSTGYLSSRLGRKPSLLLCGAIYLIGSLIQSISGLGCSPSVGLSILYFSRALGGIGVGMVSAVVPSYVSECVPRVIRGRCTGLIQFSNNIGIMLGFWVNYSTSKNIAYGQMQWRIPFIVQMVPGILFVLFMLFQPESPRFLVEHQQYHEAARVLAFVTRKSVDDEAVVETLEEIKADFEGRGKLSIVEQVKHFGESRATALRCFIPSLVMFFQQWTGTNAINYFSPSIFESLGISGTTSGLFATGIYGVVKVVSVSLVLLFAVEGFGRKNCLIVGGLGQGATMLYIGIFQAIHSSSKVVPGSYVAIVSIYIYAIFYCIGWGPVPWVIAGEVSPNHVRTASLACAIAVNWLFSFTISKLTPTMLDKITYGTYLLFGVLCLIMSLWVYFCLPETTGYALEDMRYLFEGPVIVRALQDAPGGRIFLGDRRALPVDELRDKVASQSERVESEDKSEFEMRDGEVHRRHVAPI
ncbi:general substrate transporter [Fistulina hepatica ATCC 64428]|nr:general substrate transporter [Fistulina hepatica ATCC 64428]